MAVREITPMFRRDAPSGEEIDAFHRDGSIAFPEVFTETALAGLIEEIHAQEAVKTFLAMPEEERRPRLSGSPDDRQPGVSPIDGMEEAERWMCW